MSEKKEMMIKIDSEEATDNKKSEESRPENKETPVTGEKIGDAAVEDLLKELEVKLEAKEQEAKEIYERLLRVAAEFENYKKRSAREMEDFRKFANQSLLKEMLSVVDNLELAMNSAHGKHVSKSSLLEGLHLTHKEI
jgi:molecular chaperone GrpE